MAGPDSWRWVVFTRSVISTVGNPDAHLFRAIGAALAGRGADVLFFEERANPALVALLRQQGSRGLDAFRARHPALRYRTVQPRTGHELVEWLGAVLATADVALVQHDVPPELVRAVGTLTRRHLQTYLIDGGLAVTLPHADLAERQVSSYSGVFVGRADAVASYAALVPPERLHVFGPLKHSGADDSEPPPSLRPVAEALVGTITCLAAIERARGTENGRGGTPMPGAR